MLLPEIFTWHFLREYPQMDEAIAMILAQRDELKKHMAWPDTCALPSSLVKSLLLLAGSTGVQTFENASILTASYIWQQTKQVFRFDPVLMEELENQPFTGDIPTEILHRLPVPCVYVEGKTDFLGHPMSGFFAYLDCYGENDERLSLIYISDRNEYQTTLIPLCGTIDDSIEKLLITAQKAKGVEQTPFTEVIKSQKGDYEQIKRFIGRVLNTLLYLCSDQPDYDKPPRKRSTNPKKTTISEERAPRVPSVTVAGTRIGAVIRKGCEAEEREQRRLSHDGKSTPKTPHIRRAHWHHYWMGAVGSDERRLILKWIPPVFVGAESAEVVTIHPVK